jgi:hypothetical protein
MYVRYVRGNPAYGRNVFHDNGDGTITDRATGLMWAKADSGQGMNWEQALAYAANMQLGGHADWRVPNAKELQSIVDYERLPACHPLFQVSQLDNGDYPYYWSSTTQLNDPPAPGELQGGFAVYIAFGRALVWTQYPPNRGAFHLILDDGAGAQRSDHKFGNPLSFPHGHNVQGDEIHIYNFVRCVRNVQD